MWKRKLEAVKAVKFLWKRKHFEKRSWKLEAEANLEATSFIRSWKRKQKYSTASTSLLIINEELGIVISESCRNQFSWLSTKQAIL